MAKATKKTGKPRARQQTRGVRPNGSAGAVAVPLEVPADLAALVADPHNRRAHPERNVAMLRASLEHVGAARSIVIDEAGTVLAGNGVLQAAVAAGLSRLRVVDADGSEVVAVRRSGLSEAQKRALALYDNRVAELAEWNAEQLRADALEGLPLDPWFTGPELRKLGVEFEDEPEAAIPAPRATSITVGDVFALGRHRLLCGDTTDAAQVAAVLEGRAVDLVQSDPPYGMGKEADGIANDNLYNEKHLAFQWAWWRAWMPMVAANGSAYIWGNAPDLWRWWWAGGLSQVEGLMVRNEIVWNKGTGFGMASAGGHSFTPATERCLFLMRGQQFLGNQNLADYWDGYEPLRAWCEAQRDAAGWTNAAVNALTKTNMAGHWFTKSQFHPISRKHYDTLRAAAAGRAFVEDYDALFGRLFPEVRGDGNAYRRELSAELRASRTFFDNAHDAMTDVWDFPRVKGDERFEHATPKPVAMMARVLRSSCPPGGVVAVPFAGTGPEFIAAEDLERTAIGIDIEPTYCQVVIDRWEAATGQKAVKVGALEVAAS